MEKETAGAGFGETDSNGNRVGRGRRRRTELSRTKINLIYQWRRKYHVEQLTHYLPAKHNSSENMISEVKQNRGSKHKPRRKKGR